MNEKEFARFASSVALPDSNGCMLWLLSTKNGYGQVMVDRKISYAHRVSYEHFVGAISDGQHTRHSCDIKRCVAPDHLSVGTPAENTQDMVSRGRHGNQAKTRCVWGHELKTGNLVRWQWEHRKVRACLICSRRTKAAWAARNKVNKV